MVEYEAIKNHVTLWDVAVERQIMVKGRDAEAFVDYVITRDATKISPMRARYVILCNPQGGVLNDPVLLRLSKDEFWFSLADSDVGMYLQGVNHDKRFDVIIDEIDVCPLQVQGPKSLALMKDLVGDQVNIDDIPFYGLAQASIAGHDCIISRTGFSGEAGFEVYLRDSTLHAEDLWYAILSSGKQHNLMVTAPPHCRRIQAGILSWGQDMDHQHNPFQCNLGYQVSLSGKGKWDKKAPYIGKEMLEDMRDDLRNGMKPYKLQLVGLEMGGKPIEDFLGEEELLRMTGMIEALREGPIQDLNISMLANTTVKNQHPNGLISLESHSMKNARINHLKPTSAVNRLDLLHGIAMVFPLHLVCRRKADLLSLFIGKVSLSLHRRNALIHSQTLVIF